MSLFSNVNKTFGLVGSSVGAVTDLVEAGQNSFKILQVKVDSSIQEEEIEQAKNRILVKAEAIKEIAKALNCSLVEAEQLLNKELGK